MQFKTKVIYSTVFAALLLIASIVMPIVPCRTAPVVPNPTYKWAMCSLNPDSVISINSIREYFGYTTSITNSYFMLIIISFVAAMVFFHFTTKKKKD